MGVKGGPNRRYVAHKKEKDSSRAEKTYIRGRLATISCLRSKKTNSGERKKRNKPRTSSQKKEKSARVFPDESGLRSEPGGGRVEPEQRRKRRNKEAKKTEPPTNHERTTRKRSSETGPHKERWVDLGV